MVGSGSEHLIHLQHHILYMWFIVSNMGYEQFHGGAEIEECGISRQALPVYWLPEYDLSSSHIMRIYINLDLRFASVKFFDSKFVARGDGREVTRVKRSGVVKVYMDVMTKGE